MNRLHHLKKTLPQNLSDNSDNADVEFVVLDYNSSDGLEDYIKSELAQHILSGRLKYFKTNSPEYFNRSHSRNLAFRLATGDILCNLDADNFTGPGFASYIQKQFGAFDHIFISTSDFGAHRGKGDVLGRICIKKEHFFKITGFDERMVLYGFEDYDMINRLTMYGLKNMVIDNECFLQSITHNTKERLKNEFVYKNFSELYIRYVSHIHSEILFLFSPKEFKMATMQSNIALNAGSINNRLNTRFEYTLMENGWLSGSWKKIGENLQLNSHGRTAQTKMLNFKDGALVNQDGIDQIYYKIERPQIIEDLLFFYSQITNRLIMEKNLSIKRISVNKSGFGKDKVFKNFDSQPILLN